MLLTSQSYKYVFLIWLTAAASGVFKSASLKIALRSLSCVPKKNLSITVLKECLHKSFNLLNWNLNYKLPNSLVRTKSAIRQKELYFIICIISCTLIFMWMESLNPISDVGISPAGIKMQLNSSFAKFSSYETFFLLVLKKNNYILF